MTLSPKITNCCGFNLKHETIIIGIFQSVITFIFLILSASYAENPHELISMSDPSILPDLNILRCILIIIAVFNGIQCIFSILLIFGAETNRPLLLVPWLTFNPVAILTYVITTLVAVSHYSGSDPGFVMSHLIIAFILCLISSYKIVVVHSYFKHLKSLNF